MARTLLDVQESIERFVVEARTCATQRMGFAAMLTVFPVILSVSEAVYTPKKGLTGSDHDKELFKDFVPRMADKSWLVLRSSSSLLSDQDIAIELLQIRNGLAHQLSLPDYVGLVNTKTEAPEFFKEHPHVKHIVSVVELVDAVSATIDDIVKKHSTKVFDPNPKGIARAPAKRVILPGGSSGSPPSR